MSPTNWKRCRQCGRKQSIRHIPDLCGACSTAKRRKEHREVRKGLT